MGHLWRVDEGKLLARVAVIGTDGWLSGLGTVADRFGSKRLLWTLVVCSAVLGGNTN